jgi:hypothetical protein
MRYKTRRYRLLDQRQIAIRTRLSALISFMEGYLPVVL